ncbi:3-hydroxyacyl-CoA dehydrogenase NAD-binding domain-containing protein [Advenella sp. FME57]|uniref:3-hydroxyacyl-CoA dehydrogenase NAD-binding domain-containing protein n=1 Tax=Advenella sp. FME57 TaxID=2742604 RepID=UPI0018692A15|nr:3-hydroxyacyl-CoA dehydrogenase NAD-binding domain-containing protein [Advenella sp. FME57]
MSELVTCTKDGDVSIVTINNPPINASSQAVREKLKAALAQLRNAADIKAVMLCCAGRTFMAGADIREFDLPEIPAPDPNEIHALLESMQVPVVAVMHGTVLGGGLELGLACHYRVALASTEMGLPEVKLGILPGGGGTQRLPRLVGFTKALDMIVTGKSMSAANALDIGLVDALFDGDLHAQTLEYCRSIAGSDCASRVLGRLPVELSATDKLVLEERVNKLPSTEKGGNAARAAAKSTEKAGSLPFAEGLKYERQAFIDCRNTNESKALRHVFFAEREAARIPNLPRDLGLRTIQSVGIVGAGTMGTGIAMSFANAGFPVVLQDLSPQTLSRADEIIDSTYQGSAAKNRITPEQAQHRAGLITTTEDDMQLSSCDLIIEAVFENFDIKKAIFKRLGQIAKPGAILASNTSSLDVNVLAQCSGRAADVLGMHFFSPANIMRLLEVVRCDQTAPEVLATIMHLAKRIGKVPVVSGVCFGFIGNRMLEGYLREAEFLLLEGATPGFIDKALEDYGMAMGPCRMIDMAGVDVASKVVLEQKKSGNLPDDDTYRVVVQKLHEQGRFGQKTSSGYYRYEGRTPVEDSEALTLFSDLAQQHGITQRTDISAQEVVERCLYPLIAEGYRILEEGIAYRSGDIDTVWLHGYGFPAYRGGPMFYATTIGESNVVASMQRYAKNTGNTSGYWSVPASLSKGAN